MAKQKSHALANMGNDNHAFINFPLYFDIATDALIAVRSSFPTWSSQRSLDEDKRDLAIFRAAHRQMVHSSYTCVVFSALTLESLINSYAETRLTQTSYKDLDRLSTIKKFKYLPSLVGSFDYDHECAAHQAIEKLFALRNRIVHDRTRYVSPHDFVPGVPSIGLDEAEASVKAVVLNFKELNRRDSGWGLFGWDPKVPPKS